jgi:hypothetical protein
MEYLVSEVKYLAKSGFERLKFMVKVERSLNSRYPMVTKGWTIMQCRRVEEAAVEFWAKIVWISLLESAEVALVTRQYNVPDLWQVNRWRSKRTLRDSSEVLMWMRCVLWKKIANSKSSKVSQAYSFWITSHFVSSAGSGYFVVMSCTGVWVCHNVIMTEVWHTRPLPFWAKQQSTYFGLW